MTNLRVQARDAKVYNVNADGSIIRVKNQPSTSAAHASPIHFVPVEASAKDVDGVTIHVLLHVRNGSIYELEYVGEPWFVTAVCFYSCDADLWPASNNKQDGGLVVMADREQSHNPNRGFASMDETRQRDIASRGGQASGGNFKNDPERASEAGRKGGQNVPAEERSFSRDRDLAAEAGRRGGEHSHAPAAGTHPSGEPVGSSHPGGISHSGSPAGGTVGREVPEHSKSKDTEIAVEAGKRGGEH